MVLIWHKSVLYRCRVKRKHTENFSTLEQNNNYQQKQLQLTMSTTTITKKRDATLEPENPNKRVKQDTRPEQEPGLPEKSTCCIQEKQLDVNTLKQQDQEQDQEQDYELFITFKVTDDEASIFKKLKPFDLEEHDSRKVYTLSDCREEFVVKYYIVDMFISFDTTDEYLRCKRKIMKIFKGPFTTEYGGSPGPGNTLDCLLKYKRIQL
jgi:hypothetical protein